MSTNDCKTNPISFIVLCYALPAYFSIAYILKKCQDKIEIIIINYFFV